MQVIFTGEDGPDIEGAIAANPDSSTFWVDAEHAMLEVKRS